MTSTKDKARHTVKCQVKCQLVTQTSAFLTYVIFEINGVEKKARAKCIRLPKGQRESTGLSHYADVTWKLTFEDKTVREHPDYEIIRYACIKELRKTSFTAHP